MPSLRTLRSRLFFWFFGAILLAISISAFVGIFTHPESVTGVDAMARNVSARLSSTWDDPAATQDYMAELRDVTGFDVRLERDVHKLPRRVHVAARHGAPIVPDDPQHVFLPVMRQGELVGAVEMDRFGPRPRPRSWGRFTVWPWWRLVYALVLVGGVLSIMASRVADRLARPLERLAHAADRFGGGDLTFRADVAGARRWVAAEVRDVGIAFNRMADRVEAMVRSQRELLGAISHELRSPLGRARVALEIARERASPAADAPVHVALDDVEKQLTAVDGILGDLLDITRAGLADTRKEMRALLPWLRAQVADEAQPPALRVDCDPSLEGLTLAFDGPLLSRALHNLVRNARIHGHPADQPIVIGVTAAANKVVVVVADRGPGFPAGLAERAFEPFVRGNAARTRPAAGSGSGLGLTIVRRVIEAHGGTVFARNASGGEGGAEVGFELPVTTSNR